MTLKIFYGSYDVYLPYLSFRLDGSGDEYEAVRRLLKENFPALKAKFDVHAQFSLEAVSRVEHDAIFDSFFNWLFQIHGLKSSESFMILFVISVDLS